MVLEHVRPRNILIGNMIERSEQLTAGELIQRFPNVHEVFCGHSHFAAEAKIGEIRAVNIGSSYRHKVFETVELPD